MATYYDKGVTTAPYAQASQVPYIPPQDVSVDYQKKSFDGTAQQSAPYAAPYAAPAPYAAAPYAAVSPQPYVAPNLRLAFPYYYIRNEQ